MTRPSAEQPVDQQEVQPIAQSAEVSNQPAQIALAEIISRLGTASHIYDLGVPLFQGMPNGPNHSPFLYSLTKLHGEVVYSGGASAANDMFSMGSHVGTHIDALGHVSRHGRLGNGVLVDDVQTKARGLAVSGIDTTAPIIGRGVLLDIARLRGRECLDDTDEVTANDLEAAQEINCRTVQRGDVVLIRTGWMRNWPDARRYLANPCPGVTIEGANWLVERGASIVGSDTAAFELVPARGLAVHIALMVDADVQIIEMLDLESLSTDPSSEFLFVALPLRIVGATASPIRPIAIT